jgi:peptidyl-dipeptidase Dcp
MRPGTFLAGAGLAAALFTSAVIAEDTMKNPPAPANPLLAPWSGPYGGVPPFDAARVEQLEPALEAAMAAQLVEIDRIAADPAAPTFENTLAALERSGRALRRVNTVYGIYSSSLNDEAVQAVEREMAPRLAAFNDQITQNEALFRRIAAVYETRDKSGLTAEQQRLAWLYYTNYVRAGARLEPAAKKRLSEVNQQLASLYTKFGQNILADENDGMLVLDSEADLAGLPESVREGAAQDAESRGRKGAWVIANTRSSVEPFLTYSERRDLREKVWRMFVNRGDSGGATDNNSTVAGILKLRAERAKLLGYETHAHWRLETSMAKNPQRAMELMEAVWTPAVARVREEVADMQAIADKEGAGIRIEPWDSAITPRRCASPGTTSTRPRSRRTCSSKTCARPCSTWPASCSASASSRSIPPKCRSITPTCAPGK